MKKAVVLMLTLVVLLTAFCGCGQRDVDDGETVPDGTTETLPDSTAPEPGKE